MGRTFLRLVHKRFSHILLLRNLFNKNDVKVTYSCTKNLDKYFALHNNLIYNTYLNYRNRSPDNQACNCRNCDLCSMNGKCMCKGIIYKASIIHNDQTKSFFGLERAFCHHKMTFNDKRYANATTFSKFYWTIKSNDYTPNERTELVIACR